MEQNNKTSAILTELMLVKEIISTLSDNYQSMLVAIRRLAVVYLILIIALIISIGLMIKLKSDLEAHMANGCVTYETTQPTQEYHKYPVITQ